MESPTRSVTRARTQPHAEAQTQALMGAHVRSRVRSAAGMAVPEHTHSHANDATPQQPHTTTLVLEAGTGRGCSPERWLWGDGTRPILRWHRNGLKRAQSWPEPRACLCQPAETSCKLDPSSRADAGHGTVELPQSPAAGEGQSGGCFSRGHRPHAPCTTDNASTHHSPGICMTRRVATARDRLGPCPGRVWPQLPSQPRDSAGTKAD